MNVVQISERVTLHTGGILSLSVQEKVARNHYQVLGVRKNATRTEIKSAFVTLSKKYHPDSNPEQNQQSAHINSRAFVAVCEAYQTLSSPKRRARYDSELSIAEPYRTQYEQRFYRRSGASKSAQQPFTSDGYGTYSTGGGHTSHQYYNYDERDVDWELYRQSIKRSNHSRVLYMLLALTFAVPTFFMFRVNSNYHKYYQPAALLESQRNTAAYMAVRDRARNTSVQEQLDLLVERHAKKTKDCRPNR